MLWCSRAACGMVTHKVRARKNKVASRKNKVASRKNKVASRKNKVGPRLHKVRPCFSEVGLPTRRLLHCAATGLVGMRSRRAFSTSFLLLHGIGWYIKNTIESEDYFKSTRFSMVSVGV